MRKNTHQVRYASLAAVLAACMVTPSALASLSSTYQFNGKGNWSIDAIGGNTSPVGTVEAEVPTGSTVVKAFLYSSTLTGGAITPSVSLDGTTYSGAAWTPLGVNIGILQAYRADVTSQVAAKIGSGSASRFSFEVNEVVNNGGTDGEVLVVVYSNPSEAERTIGILDGFSASSGDSTSINFASPLTGVGEAGFEAILSLGIGFSYQENATAQYSIIDGNGRRLTTSAGGSDDGVATNGGLITAGGLDDSTDNPNPTILPGNARTDDELYDLAKGNVADPTPFLSNGLTSYTFETLNPSADDNIFFLGINITAVAGINEPPPPQVIPETSTVISGLAVVGLAGMAWRKRSRKA